MCDAQYPVLRPSYGPDIDVNSHRRAASPSELSRSVSSGSSLAEVAHRLRSSISRLPKHRVVPPDVCDAQYPALRPSYGPEIDVTVAAESRAPPLSLVCTYYFAPPARTSYLLLSQNITSVGSRRIHLHDLYPARSLCPVCPRNATPTLFVRCQRSRLGGARARIRVGVSGGQTGQRLRAG